MIIPQLLALLAEWRPVFAQARTHKLAVQMALSVLGILGRHTISQRLVLLGRMREDGTKFYRLFNLQAWEVTSLFDQLIRGALPWCPGRYLVVAGDDTLLKKTGKLIHHVGYLRDPLSPKFRYHLVLGLRCIQRSVLVPLYRQYPDAVSALALPIRFKLAPVIRKPKSPRKPMTPAEEEAFQNLKAANTLSQYMAELIPALRTWMDDHGLKAKILLLVVDNGYCNKVVFAAVTQGIASVARLKKNNRLYLPGMEAGAGFTPEEFRQNRETPWAKCQAYVGRTEIVLRYKECAQVVWPSVTGARIMRLIVIAGTPYRRRKYATISYRPPGYLLTTDLTASVEFLIQSYLDRWQIEVNHRDEKSLVGVGEAQGWTEQAVTREPAFAVAAYSLMKLAALQALGPTRTAAYGELPAWYAGPTRPSCEDVMQKVRREAWEHPEWLAPYGVNITPEGLVKATRA